MLTFQCERCGVYKTPKR